MLLALWGGPPFLCHVGCGGCPTGDPSAFWMEGSLSCPLGDAGPTVWTCPGSSWVWGPPPIPGLSFQDAPVTFQTLRCQSWTGAVARGAEGTLNLTPVTQLHLGGLQTLPQWPPWRWQRPSFGGSVSPASSVCHSRYQLLEPSRPCLGGGPQSGASASPGSQSEMQALGHPDPLN